MTDQEQKAFTAMREALSQVRQYSVLDRRELKFVVEALDAANAMSEQQGEAARLKAFLHKHKSSALPEGACVTCEGEGEIGGQFCGKFQECSDCAGTGKKSAHPQATEPQKAASGEPRTTEQIVLDMEVWFEAQEPMPDSMTAAKEFARRIRNQTEQDIAKVIQRRGWELMRSESGYFLRDATAAEAHHGK